MPFLDGEILSNQVKVAFQATARLDDMMKEIFAGGASSDAINFVRIASCTDDFAISPQILNDCMIERREDQSSWDKYMRDEDVSRALSEFEFTEYVFATVSSEVLTIWLEYDNAVMYMCKDI